MARRFTPAFGALFFSSLNGLPVRPRQPIRHMPQRTSKILLVRLTANKNALLFQIRVTCFARYTVQLRTLTGFHFTHDWKHRLESFLLTVYTKILYWFSLFSLITLNDHDPQFLITLCITIRDEHDALFD